MIPAGQRNQRVTFERNTAARSAMGGAAVPNWQPLTNAFAFIRYGTSAERRGAAGEQALQTATIRVLASYDARRITHQDRIVFDGLAWDITSIAPIGGPSPSEIEFTAMASRD